ncbi:hypothetical protein F3J23_03370 [Chryseobacterium sp. Tr-659]|uniref:hypothetical protein n=1 Tax=Chryseobacterium sp. Tr-659 TaxID=2608340 RepID=UPI0014234865|nr:hypothetical protein [Chryseobacterium sp. Tr-659]NIF04473.1 hypothetical protein [Chryseobacterium sp. Tr-659]
MNKNIISVLIVLLTVISMKAQTVNWAALNEEKHLLNANVGAEYGAIIGLGYGYKFGGMFPMITGVEFSVPLGDTLLDDFKVKAGTNIRWVKISDFQLSTRVQGVFRRFENENAAILNFGLDMAGVIGYYRPKWFIGGEAGFDKAIVTHFKHSGHYKEIYPGVKDGWYEPATGGNFYYGLQGGYSFTRQEIYLKVGNIISQDFKTKPHLPFFAQIGYNYKF